MLKFQVTDEIELRPFAEEDADQIFTAVKANYEHLRPFLHWVNPDYSLQSAREFIVQSQKAFAEKTSQAFGLFYQNKLVGSIGFVNLKWDSKLSEIGYWIARDFEGQGIITKSCQVLINYAFEDLKMNRIEIRCATENVKSSAIPERLGFKLEGVLRQSLWRHTRLYDLAVYGLLQDDLKISPENRER